jgi:FixJ family two-component response regulator
MQSRGTVLIIDHDPASVEGMERLLQLHGYFVRTFSAPGAFLGYSLPSERCCAIIDAEFPDWPVMHFHMWLAKRRPGTPFIEMTASGNIPQAVEAIRRGAADYLTKPVEHKKLIYAVQHAFVEEERLRPKHEERAAFDARFKRLTPREKEVYALVIQGKLNKQIAADLGTCEKTIKVHRGRLMKKMEAASLAALVREAVSVHSFPPVDPIASPCPPPFQFGAQVPVSRLAP